MVENSLLKYYKELNLLGGGVFVLAEEEEDKYIEKVIIKIEPHCRKIFTLSTMIGS